METLSSIRLAALRIRSLNLRRGLFRLWVLAALPIAAISAISSIEKYQAEASRYHAWKSRLTISEATERCVGVIDALKNTRMTEEILPPKLEEYFKQKRASAEREYAHLVRLPQEELREACQRRAEQDEDVALTLDKPHPPSLLGAAIQALVTFASFATVPLAGAITLWGVGSILIRWLVNGFKL